jgi:hypothetical protein
MKSIELPYIFGSIFYESSGLDIYPYIFGGLLLNFGLEVFGGLPDAKI